MGWFRQHADDDAERHALAIHERGSSGAAVLFGENEAHLYDMCGSPIGPSAAFLLQHGDLQMPCYAGVSYFT